MNNTIRHAKNIRDSIKMCSVIEVKTCSSHLCRSIKKMTTAALANDATTVDCLSGTKTERNITTNKPLSVMVNWGKYTVSSMVRINTKAAKMVACILES
jgi:hypothetical protein